MRYVLYLLVAANILYLGWNISRGGVSDPYEQARSLPAVPKGVAMLVLLRDVSGRTDPATGAGDHIAAHAAMTGEPASVDFVQNPDTTDAQMLQVNAQPALVCRSLGPFDELSAAQAVYDRVAGLGMSPVLRSMDSREVDDYWVYVPGRGQDYSREVVRQLTEHRMNDFYVFDNDDYLISLGAFRSGSHAENQLAALRGIGLEAVLEKRYRTRTQHWVEVTVEQQHDEQLRDISLQSPGLQLTSGVCMSLARN